MMDKMHTRNGQSLVEFALILPILMLLILGIFEGARIIQAYISAQNASQEAARFAISGRPLDAGGNPWSGQFSDEIRVELIQDVAIDASIGTGYQTVYSATNTYDLCNSGSNANCSGVLGVKVSGQHLENSEVIWHENRPGIQGLNVRVQVYHNVQIWDPIYAAITPGGFVRVSADTIMRNEGVDPALQGIDIFNAPTPTPPNLPPCHPNCGAGPRIEVNEGNRFSPGDLIHFRLIDHPLDTYDIYLDTGNGWVLVNQEPITPNDQGLAIVPAPSEDAFQIPLNTTIGGHTIQSRKRSTGEVVASNLITIVPPEVGDIVVNNNTSLVWPRGSELEYQLIFHNPNASDAANVGVAMFNLDQGGIPRANWDPVDVRPDGHSITDTHTYIIPTDLITGTYAITSSQGATRTITITQGCIRIDQGLCDETPPPTYPRGSQIYLHLDNLATNGRGYQLEFRGVSNPFMESLPGTFSTNGDGQYLNIFYTIPNAPTLLLDGDYEFVLYDDDDSLPNVPENAIVRKPITLQTPEKPFIQVIGGYRWPAGSQIILQLSEHAPSEFYDLYWRQKDQAQATRVITNAITTGEGESEWPYTIPIDTSADLYYVESRLNALGVSTTGPFSNTETLPDFPPIEVFERPYLRIAEGNPQVPGAPITVEIGNHIINGEYHLYLVEDELAGTLRQMTRVDSPVAMNTDGDGELNYTIPPTLAAGQSYLIHSYQKDETPADSTPTATTTLTLLAPDIQVAGITFPNGVAFNRPITVSVTVSNTSLVSITHRSIDVDIYIDPLQEPLNESALPPGNLKLWLQPPFAMNSTRTITTQMTLFGDFDHELWIKADTSNRVVETDETNNRLQTIVSQQSCQLDLDHDDFDGLIPIRYGQANNASATLTVNSNQAQIVMENTGNHPIRDDDETGTDAGYAYAALEATENFDVQVKLTAKTGNTNGEAGIEIRGDTGDSASDKVQWLFSKDNKLAYNTRLSGTRDGDSGLGLGGLSLPVWLRVVKDGPEMTLYYSAEDVPDAPSTWIEETMLSAPELAGSVYVGLMNTNRTNNGDTSEATFDYFHLCGTVSGTCGPIREAKNLIVVNASNHIGSRADLVTNEVWKGFVREGQVGMRVPNLGYTSTITQAARLDYEVDVINGGTYYVWLLGTRPEIDSDASNSVFFGLDALSASVYESNNPIGAIEWFTQPVSNTITLAPNSPQTLRLWMQEDGFEIYQILLTKDAGFDPTGQGAHNQSQCANLGVPPIPPGLRRCESVIINGDFELPADNAWDFDFFNEHVNQTTVPHYNDGGSFSMVLPNRVVVGNSPDTPWLSQEFTLPSWVLSGSTTIDLGLNVGVNPFGNNEPDELLASLRDTTGTTDVISPTVVITGGTIKTLEPPFPSHNNDWHTISKDLATGFNPPSRLLDFADQNLQLYFEAPNPNGSTEFYVDNVDLEICSTQPRPTNFGTLVQGVAHVFIDGVPEPKEGIFVWAYAIDGTLEKTYTIQDSTFSFYDLPAEAGGTTYVLYAEYEEDGTFYSAVSIVLLQPGQIIDNVSLLLF